MAASRLYLGRSQLLNLPNSATSPKPSTMLLKILTKNWGACGHTYTCCGHLIQPDLSKRLVSWNLFHDIKALCNSSEQVTEMGLLWKDRKRIVENLWHEFFSDPSQWWDHRADKGNARYPDFKHKKTDAGLWINGKLKPPWVEAQLAAMPPGTVQMNVFGWNVRLARYSKAGLYEKTIRLFKHMQHEGVIPNKFTFVPVLRACACLSALDEGRVIHTQIRQHDCEADLYVGSSLVDMYSKCGSIDDAWRVFKAMPTRDVVVWNAMIQGYVRCGQAQKALELFRGMQQKGVKPDPVTFLGVVNACASTGTLEEGKLIHEQIMQSGYEPGLFMSSSLVDMYSKCGSIEEAWNVFDKMPMRNVVTWNAMILGHVKCGLGRKALELFTRMQHDGVEPDSVTFVGLVNACASMGALEEGKVVHEQAIRRGCDCDPFVGSSLIDMYAKCGSMDEACKVFKAMPIGDVVSWNAMINGFVKGGQGKKALELYQEMLSAGLKPDPVTFVGLLNACASVGALEEGRHVHEEVIQSSCELDVFVGNSLVDMYAKCGSIEDAWRVFNNMPTRDVVCWNAMIMGYVKCGQGLKAIELSQRMHKEQVQPDSVTFMALLNACTSVAALEEGRQVHEQIIQSGCVSDVLLGNSLVDMYAKCGAIEDAWTVFCSMPARDVISWNSMLGAYSVHGHYRDSLGLFKAMFEEGIQMDQVTFVSLLSACSHAGLVDEGLHYFESMASVYRISVAVDHYACVVDLLSRAGRLHEAEDLIKTMSCKPDSTVWTALLAACRALSNVEMGKCIAETVLKVDPGNSAGYVLLSNIYAAASMA